MKLLPDIHGSAAFLESCLHRRMQTGLEIFPIGLIHILRKVVLHARQLDSVYEKIHLRRIISSLRPLHDLFDPYDTICKETGIAFLLQLKHKLYLILSGLPVQICQYVCRRRIAFKKTCHHIIYRMALHLQAGNRRICTSYTGEDHSQIIEDLRACSYGRAWISCIHLLLYRDSRRDAFNQLHIRLGHSAQELPRI